MSKPKVAVFDFACCEGCQLQLINLEEELTDLLSVIEPVCWREAMSEEGRNFDIAIIEGSVTRKEDEDKVKMIRKKAAIVIALGACAVLGGVNKLKNNFDLEEVKESVYPNHADRSFLNTGKTKALHEVIPVDVSVPGCPIDRREFKNIIKSLLLGKKPEIPAYPVCVECKQQENICRYEKGEICLGPITRAGCGAKCPSGNFWCFGCRGLVDEANINAAYEIMEKYGKTAEELKRKISLFNSL